jgi:hypothetical protein
MTTCSDSQPSALMSRSEYLSTLPLWRPVYDIEQLKTESSRLAALESRLDALLLNFDSYSP